MEDHLLNRMVVEFYIQYSRELEQAQMAEVNPNFSRLSTFGQDSVLQLSLAESVIRFAHDRHELVSFLGPTNILFDGVVGYIGHESNVEPRSVAEDHLAEYQSVQSEDYEYFAWYSVPHLAIRYVVPVPNEELDDLFARLIGG